jgi:3-isopropylmalate/(R)-2-methylmalate dehydratase small subunit
MIIKGNTIILQDNINTDEIIPGRYLSINDPDELAKHTFIDKIQDFQGTIKKTGIIVAGDNFGGGSSREQAAICLKYSNVKAIIAQSFARIFFRNAINLGLPVIEIPDATKIFNSNDRLIIHLNEGIIKNQRSLHQYQFQPLPDWMLEMIEAGGYISWSKSTSTQ